MIAVLPWGWPEWTLVLLLAASVAVLWWLADDRLSWRRRAEIAEELNLPADDRPPYTPGTPAAPYRSSAFPPPPPPKERPQ